MRISRTGLFKCGLLPHVRAKHSFRRIYEKVAQFLRDMDYSLQGNRKTEEGNDHPDRDAKFEHINQQVRRALAAGRPVISVGTKKKELLGNYENKGRKWRKTKSPEVVNGHDFPHPSVPRAHPYGIYDLSKNRGFVNVGTDRDTGAFAVASIRGWWRFEGKPLYPAAQRLLITADGGGSNGYCLAKGLTVSCRLDRRKYPTGRIVTKEEMATIRIIPRPFHGEWNYVIRPRETAYL